MISCKSATFIVFLFFFLSTRGQKKEHHNLILEVHFQSHFKNDTVDIKIKNCCIGRNILLNSDEILGFANEKFSFISRNNIMMIIKNSSDTTICKSSEINSLDIVLNKKAYIFKIDFKKGKYIGFYKDEDGKLQFSQSKSRFSYF